MPNRSSDRRLWEIDREIRSGTFPSARRLAEKLEVHPRTILRNIEHLRDQRRALIEVYQNFWVAPRAGAWIGTPIMGG